MTAGGSPCRMNLPAPAQWNFPQAGASKLPMPDRLSTLLRSIASPLWEAVLALVLAASLTSLAPAPAAAATARAGGANLLHEDCGAGTSGCGQICSDSCPSTQASIGASKPPSLPAGAGARAWPLQWPDKAASRLRRTVPAISSPLHGRLRL